MSSIKASHDDDAAHRSSRRKRPLQFLDYFESVPQKKIKSGISRIDIWKIVFNMRNEVEKCLVDIGPLYSHVVLDPTPGFRRPDALSRLDKHFAMLHIFCEKTHSSIDPENSKGVLLFFCSLAVRFFPSMLLFRPEIRTRTFQLFQLLFRFDKEGFYLFFSSLLSESGGKLEYFIPRPYYQGSPAEEEVTLSLYPSYYCHDELLRSLVEPHSTKKDSGIVSSSAIGESSSLFDVKVQFGDAHSNLGPYSKKILFLCNLISLVKHLLNAEPLWRPCTLWVSKLLDGVYALLSLSDARATVIESQSVKDKTSSVTSSACSPFIAPLDVFYTSECGELLLQLRNRQLLRVDHYSHGPLLLYYIVQCMEMKATPSPIQRDPQEPDLTQWWELDLLLWISEALQRISSFGATSSSSLRLWRMSILHIPRLLESMVKCMMAFYSLSIKVHTSAMCFAAFQIVHAIAVIIHSLQEHLRSIENEAENLTAEEMSSRSLLQKKIFEVAIKLNFSLYLEDLILNTGYSKTPVSLVARLQRDACTVSCTVLSVFLRTLPSQWIREVVLSIPSSTLSPLMRSPSPSNTGFASAFASSSSSSSCNFSSRSVEYVATVLSSLLCRQAVRERISVLEMENVLDSFRSAWSAVVSSKKDVFPTVLFIRSFTTICALLWADWKHYYMENSALYDTLFLTLRLCAPHVRIDNYRTEGIFITNLMEVLAQQMILLQSVDHKMVKKGNRTIDNTLALFSMCLQDLLQCSSLSHERLEMQGMLLTGMAFGLHRQSARLVRYPIHETSPWRSHANWHVLDGSTGAASLRMCLGVIDMYLLFVTPYRLLCEDVFCGQCFSSLLRHYPSRKRSHSTFTDSDEVPRKLMICSLLEPLFSIISQVQLHVHFFIASLAQISYHEPQIQSQINDWISTFSLEKSFGVSLSTSFSPSSSSSPIVINVDEGDEQENNQNEEGNPNGDKGVAPRWMKTEETSSLTPTGEERGVDPHTCCFRLQAVLNQRHRGIVDTLCKGLRWLDVAQLSKQNGKVVRGPHTVGGKVHPGASTSPSTPFNVATTRSFVCRAACAAFCFEYFPPSVSPSGKTSALVSHPDLKELAAVVETLFLDYVFHDVSYVTRCGFGGLAISLLARYYPSFSLLDLAQKRWGKDWPFFHLPAAVKPTSGRKENGSNEKKDEETKSTEINSPSLSATPALGLSQWSRMHGDLLVMRCACSIEQREGVFLSAGIPSHPILETPPVFTALHHKDIEKLLGLALRNISGTFFSSFSKTPKVKRKGDALYPLSFFLSTKDVLLHATRDALQDFLRCLRWSDADVLQSDPTLIHDLLSYSGILYWRGERLNGISRGWIVQELLTYGLPSVVGTPHQKDFVAHLRSLLSHESQTMIQRDIFAPLQCGAAVAKLLWNQSSNTKMLPDSSTAESEEELLSLLDDSKEVLHADPLQRVLRRAFFFLLSLQGDYLVERENEVGEEVCYAEGNPFRTEVWHSLLHRLVSLKNVTALSRENVFGAVAETSDASSQLSSDLFFIVNMVRKCTNVEAVTLPILSKSSSGYGKARRKWLLALRSLIPFLGEKVSLIMSYVASLLNSFSQDPHLVALVGSVWCTLLQHCSKDYLTADLMPFMMMELLLLEQKCWSNWFGHTVLRDAMSFLLYKDYEEKKEAQEVVRGRPTNFTVNRGSSSSSRRFSFGAPYLHLFAKTSRILHAYGLSEDGRTAMESVALSDVIDSCLFLLQKGSSEESKQFVLHSLHHYLHDMSIDERMRFAAEPSARVLVYTLMKIVRDLPDDVVEILLRTIGLIGAISLSSLSTGISRSVRVTASSSSGERPATLSSGERKLGSRGRRTVMSDDVSEDSESAGKSVLSSSLTVEKDEFTFSFFLSWRKIMFVLLNRFIPQALAGSDMVVHLDAAFASQELIRMGIERENNGVSVQGVIHHNKLHKYGWWKELSPGSRQLLEVFASTDYRQRERTKSMSSDNTLLEWRFKLYCDLTDSCSSVRIKKMIIPLRRLVKRFPPLLAWLLPYVVLDALLHPDAPSILRSYFLQLYEIRSDVRISDRLQILLTLFEQLQHARWYFAVFTLRKPNLMDLTGEACERLSNVIYSLLHQDSWSQPTKSKVEKKEEEEGLQGSDSSSHSLKPLPSWAQRSLAAFSTGNSIMTIRFIEAQLCLPSMHDVKRYLGEDVVRGLFRALGDQDALKSLSQGVAVIDPAEAAFIAETNGEWSSAIQNCELVLQKNEHSVPHQVLLLRSLRHLGQLQVASQYAENLRLHHRSMHLSLAAKKRLERDACEAAWRLGKWNDVWAMEQNIPSSISSLAFPLSHWVKFVRREAPISCVYASCIDQRRKLIPKIQAISLTDEEQLYRYTSILHGLSDLEYTAASLHGFFSNEELINQVNYEVCTNSILTGLQHRLGGIVEDILQVKEPLLSLHRRMAEELPIRTSGISSVLATIMEWHVHLLRNCGYPEAALALAKQPYLNGGKLPVTLWVPTAELLYETGSKLQAVAFVQHSIEQQDHFCFVSECKTQPDRSSQVTSQLQVLLTDWKMEASDQTQDEIIQGYEKAIAMDASELAHHKLALFYEKMFLSTSIRHALPGSNAPGAVGQQDHHRYVTALKAIEHFGKALTIGCDTLLVSLPRMLTLWLDTVYELTKREELLQQDVQKKEAAVRPKRSRDAPQDRVASSSSCSLRSSKPIPSEALNEKVAQFVAGNGGAAPSAVIPLPYLLTALPQLLSRLGHPHPRVVEIISDIVVQLLQHFPQPCLWQVLPLSFGKPDYTSKIVKERILNRFSQTSSNVETRRNAEKIFESLIELCNAPPESFKNSVRLTQMPFMKEVSRLVQSFEFILPTLYNMTPDVSGKGKNFDSVFPPRKTFKGFDDVVVLMKSKQQPKRIQVLDCVGLMVPFLCKADDEPRKDMRMMDLAALMNKFFLSDADARRRGLSLHRYSVAALSSKCAIIEWVKDLSPLYPLVIGCYQCCRLGLDERKIKVFFDEAKEKKIKPIEVLKGKILPHFPPIFHCWFDKQFQSNDDWYQARNLYTSSTALWSMAGHVVGLGDRHGENLLLNQRTGEAMHVDFAEMFDSAEKLPVPEVVRFRLTPNVIDGLGVVGTSGSFQATCQIALRCQMKNSNALMSIAETHLYEPSNRCSTFSMQRMSRRLSGYLDFYNPQTSSVFPLSNVALNVEGQVGRLISHSSSFENLSEMYTWWRPWI